MIVSNKKKRFTSAAGINLGAIVTSTKGIATQRTHIKGTIIRSFLLSKKLSIKNRAKIATNNLPITAAGTKFLVLADLIVIAPIAKPIAVIKPKMSPFLNRKILFYFFNFINRLAIILPIFIVWHKKRS